MMSVQKKRKKMDMINFLYVSPQVSMFDRFLQECHTASEAFDGFHVARAFLGHLPLKYSTSPIDFDGLRSTDIQDSDFCAYFIGHLLKAVIRPKFYSEFFLGMKKKLKKKS